MKKAHSLTTKNLSKWSRQTAIVIPFFLVACGGGSSKEDDATTSLAWVSNFLGSANSTVGTGGVTSAKITNAGGIIEIKSSDSPLKGTKIIIEPNSLADDEETISVRAESTLPFPFNADALALDAQAISPILLLQRTGSVDFGKALSVTMPFDLAALPADAEPVVVYFDEATQTLSPVTVRSVDRSKGTVTFMTAHASRYVVTVVKKIFTDISKLSVSIDFDPKVDGFFVHNFGSYDTPGGNGFGMAAYSAWYHATRKASKGAGLTSLYKEGNANKEEDDQIARELVARSYQSSTQKGSIESLDWSNESNQARALADKRTGYALISQLTLTRQAQILAMGVGVDAGNGKKNWTDSHAVTVYAYDGINKKFLYYDNNNPSEVVSVPWTPDNGFGKTSKNQNFTTFTLATFNQAYSSATLDNLYQEAEQGFPESHFPKIVLTAPIALPNNTNTFEVSTDENVLIKGSAPRPSNAANPTAQRYVHVYLNGAALPTPYLLNQTNNSFEVNIPKLPNAAGTDVMLLVSESKKAWGGGFHSFKQFKVRVANQFFFKNMGFETGDFTDWFSERHLWHDPTKIIPSDKSTVITGNSQFDPTATDLSLPLFGQSVGRINNNDDSYHISSVTQTAVVPTTKNPVVRFYWSAVLEDPNHSPADQPYVDISVENTTKGITLYKKRYFANDPSYSGWVPYAGGSWKGIPWQLAEINVLQYVGDTLVLKVEAADCALGGHGGYAYLDAEE